MLSLLLFGLVAPARGADVPGLDAVTLVTQGAAVCAGVVVDDIGSVATAYHCVARGGRVWVTRADGVGGRGRVVRASRRDDVAVIAVPALAGTPAMPVASALAGPGDVVWALGHAYGARRPVGYLSGLLRWSASQGVVSASGPRALQFTAAVGPGSSGGPVVDAETGELVGIVSRRVGTGGVAFATHAARLGELAPGLRWLGGTVEVSLLGSVWGDRAATLAGGPALTVAVRDTVTLTFDAALPLGGRWDALRFGAARWVAGAGALGLRRRFGVGALSGAVEAHGVLAAVGSLDADAVTVFQRTSRLAPGWGGAVRLGAVGLRVDEIWSSGAWTARASVTFAWPGAVAFW